MKSKNLWEEKQIDLSRGRTDPPPGCLLVLPLSGLSKFSFDLPVTVQTPLVRNHSEKVPRDYN